MDTYLKQAKNFLNSTGTTFEAEFLKYGKHFEGDKVKRDIYKITLKRGSREYTFNFGQSINCSMQWIPKSIYGGNLWRKANCQRLEGENLFKALGRLNIFGQGINTIKSDLDFVKNENFSEPTEYDVLACLTKYDPETFENFCGEFGYDEDSRKAEKTYHAVKDEYNNVAMLWNEEEMEQLTEIQ